MIAISFRDEAECFEKIEASTAAIEALQSLLVGAIEADKDLRPDVSGIHDLFEPWLMHLNEAAAFLRFCDDGRRRVGEAATAKVHEAVAETGSERVRTIRRDLIGEALTKGIDPGEIASAMNMHRSAVENVKRRLLGEAGGAPDERAAVNG